MIQNNQQLSIQNSQQNSKISDYSQGRSKLTYSQMAEGIDQEQQSGRIDSFQVGQKADKLLIGGKGPKTERDQATIIDDIFQRSQNYSPRHSANDNLICLPIVFRKQSDMPIKGHRLSDNFLGVKNFSDMFMGKGRPSNKGDLKIDSLKPQKVQLGREIISSVVKSDHNNQPQFIDEGSQIINHLKSTTQRSHFQIAKIDVGHVNIFQQFQQQKKDALESDHDEIKITVTPEPIKRSSQITNDQASANGVTFAAGGITKFSMKSESKQQRPKRSIQELRVLSASKKSQEKEYLISSGLKGSKIKKLENNMIQSKIISHAQQIGPQKRSENKQKNSSKDFDLKKPIIQVADRMKSTVDPKPPTSEFKVVPYATNLSQPDKHSVHNMAQQNSKIIEPLSPSQDFLQRKQNETKIGNDMQGYLFDKIHNIQKLVENIKHCSFCSDKAEKCHIPHGDIHLEQNRERKMKHKKHSLKNLISDEVLNGLSSIDSHKKSQPKGKYHDKRNEQFNKRFQFLAERILRMQQILLRKSEKQINYGMVDQDVQSYDMKIPKFNKKSSISQTKFLKRVKSETRIYQGQQEQQSISDKDFSKLENYMSKVDFILQQDSSPQELAELGIKILNSFKIKTRKGDSVMDMTEYENCVEFYYSKSNVFIRLQFSGLFYIGNGENTSQSSQFVRQGEGIEIMPNKYVYQGEFHEDKKHGEGLINFISGDKYKGQWANNLYEGYGTLYTKTSKYQGNFQDGKKNGIGKQKFKNGDTYKGSYYLNNYNGNGQYTWSNGTTYYGEFKNDQMSGQGIWKSYCGDVYEGQYYKGKRHGLGKYIKRNGDILEGQFVNGNLAQRKCKGILQPDKQLNYDSYEEQIPRTTGNQFFSSKYNPPKPKKFIIQKQSNVSSLSKSKKYSAKW